MDWEAFARRVPIGTVVKTRDHGLLFEAMAITVGSVTGVLLENYPHRLRNDHRDYAKTRHLCLQPMHNTGLVYESAVCLLYWIDQQWMTIVQVLSRDVL